MDRKPSQYHALHPFSKGGAGGGVENEKATSIGKLLSKANLDLVDLDFSISGDLKKRIVTRMWNKIVR